MRKYISINSKIANELASKYGITTRAVWMAVSFLTKNKRGDNIRRDAIAMGGEYREEDFIPNCQTSFENGLMRQRFAAGVEVVLEGNRLSILAPERQDECYYDVDMNSWGNILAKAQRISEERKLKPVMQ